MKSKNGTRAPGSHNAVRQPATLSKKKRKKKQDVHPCQSNLSVIPDKMAHRNNSCSVSSIQGTDAPAWSEDCCFHCTQPARSKQLFIHTVQTVKYKPCYRPTRRHSYHHNNVQLSQRRIFKSLASG